MDSALRHGVPVASGAIQEVADGRARRLWPALTSAYFFSRVGAVTVLVGIGVGLTAAGLRSPDERLSVVAWVISMLVCVTSAVTVRVIAERADLLMRRLDERANNDSMTGLLNRRGFDEALDVRWSADPDGRLAVTFFDLDHFKAINDTYGHATGDAVLTRARRPCAATPTARSTRRRTRVATALWSQPVLELRPPFSAATQG